MLGTTGDTTDFDEAVLGNPNVSSRVQAVVDWYGPTDFLKMDEQLATSGCPENALTHNNADSPESLLLGKPIQEHPELVKVTNPINYITPNVPPFMIQHGSADCIVPPQQSWELYHALLKVIGTEKVAMYQLEGAGHGGMQFTDDENMRIVVQFLSKNLA
jgi:acetyl esterase/lipase